MEFVISLWQQTTAAWDGMTPNGHLWVIGLFLFGCWMAAKLWRSAE